MRIDRVGHRKVPASAYQVEVNKWVQNGCTRDQIEHYLHNTTAQAVSMNWDTVSLKPFPVLEPSHLGKGFIVFLLCPLCTRKSRNLFLLNDRLACRICHHLTYKKMDKRACQIKRLIWDDVLREKYFSIYNRSRWGMALEAEGARHKFFERGEEFAQQLIASLKRQ